MPPQVLHWKEKAQAIRVCTRTMSCKNNQLYQITSKLILFMLSIYYKPRETSDNEIMRRENKPTIFSNWRWTCGKS